MSNINSTTLFSQLFENSLVGQIRIVADNESILEVDFWDKQEPFAERPNSLTRETQKQLYAYFEHKLQVFDLPLKPNGTAFQQNVWQALMTISYGRTMSYLSLSRQIGNEKAIRAVGHANGQNPIAIIIPCHRVIGSEGKLVGYSGGLWRKRNLLRHEGVAMQGELPF